MPFDTEAWHAGRSRHAGRSNLNHYSVGIELDNLGRLEYRDGRFMAECGVAVDPREVYVDETGEAATFWHRYTERQRAACAAGHPEGIRGRGTRDDVECFRGGELRERKRGM